MQLIHAQTGDFKSIGKTARRRQNPATKNNPIPKIANKGTCFVSSGLRTSECLMMKYETPSNITARIRKKLAKDREPDIPIVRTEINLGPKTRLKARETLSAIFLKRILVLSPMDFLRSSTSIQNSSIRLTHTPSVDSLITKVRAKRNAPMRPKMMCTMRIAVIVVSTAPKDNRILS